MGSRESKQALFDQGGVLLVRLLGQAVAGALVHHRGKLLISACIGIHEDYAELVKQDVSDVRNWLLIEWASRQGFKSIDFGMTRPRLKDGVFENKRQLGNQFERDLLTQTMWTFAGDHLPAPLIQHLNNLAFIAEVGKTYCCVTCMGNDGMSAPDAELAHLDKVARRAGFGGLLYLPAYAGRDPSPA